jgi:glutathione S-transferase
MLAHYRHSSSGRLIECGAAPSLFYADRVCMIPPEHDRLLQWRNHLLTLPPVARCVDEARPYRSLLPPGAPDRDRKDHDDT